MRIPKLGPLAKVPLIEHGGLKSVVGGDDNLVQMLDGTPPAGAEKLKIEGNRWPSAASGVCQGVYLSACTPLTLLSPALESPASLLAME